MQTFETDAISIDKLFSIALRREVLIGALAAEAARVYVRQEGRDTLIGEALYLPAIRLGVFAMIGADSVRTDADSLSDAVRRVLDGDVVA